jgi:pimeloyl-ACP methyl ester carboxylesterase
MAAYSWIDRQEYPFTSKFLEVDGGNLHYIDEGQGTPIVFSHGTPVWSFVFRHLIKELSTSYRCIALDHIGFGLSDKPENWTYTPEAHALNFEKLITHLDLQGIVLVAHDFGGPIGLSYAISHPENVRKIVLSNTWMWPLGEYQQFKSADKLINSWLGRLLYKQFNFSPNILIKTAFGDKSKLTKTIHQHYTKLHSSPKERNGTYGFAKALMGSGDWFKQLWNKRQNISEIPALLLWGMKDRLLPSTLLFERLQSVFQYKKVIALEDVGHFIEEEAPEVILREIKMFLEHSQPAAVN